MKTYGRYEVALAVNADELLNILRGSPVAVIEPFGDEGSLPNALTRTVTYDPLRHEVTLVLETTGVESQPHGAEAPRHFVRLKAHDEEPLSGTHP